MMKSLSLFTVIAGTLAASQGPAMAKHMAADTNKSPVVAPDVANDPRLDPQVRSFLMDFNKNPSPFWTLPQPQPQEALSKLQDKTPVDMSGVSTVERTIAQNGEKVKLYIMSPTNVQGKPGVILFLHGGVWIVGNFHNHQRLLRDLVVGSGQVGVFVEYTPLPTAVYPTQMNEAYAALEWTAAHAGDMVAALTMMTKDRKGPKISYQLMMIPATDASVDTPSYLAYGKDRFLGRDFMKYGWDHYVSTAKMRDHRYVSPLRATTEELRDLPPALVITAENDPLRDEGEAYARKLKAAGVTVDAVRYNGTIHDFVLLNALRTAPSTEAALRQASEGIRDHLAR
jgi:acetyl esterase